ncbi:MAG TPA: zinc-dependent alcohol dehydrogenase family protein [Candidatus Binatus sp.]|nr:zinc-dependent alcohol dehydrogenase family protein [Candidatus Binatus sp.]
MNAMLLESARRPLRAAGIATPQPGPGQLLIKISACGVCRTDLHIFDGELARPKLPLVLGHEIIGVVEQTGEGVDAFAAGDRVGVPWLGWVDGTCVYCRSGRENLCEHAKFTGYDIDGGYAQNTVANAAYCFPIPSVFDDAHAAPLMCAGLIGYRGLRMTGDATRLGIYGFGAAAHIIAQVARHQGRRVFAFTRPGDHRGQSFALELGAVWAGDSDTAPPEPLDAAIIFAPVGGLVVSALRVLARGGVVVCAGIHMSDIPSFPYDLLWEERQVRSVANLTRDDAREFLRIAPQVPVRTVIRTYALERASEALDDLRAGRLEGAAVLTP